MGATLQIANDKEAYTLSDRGTYLATKSGRDLEILVEGGADLLNVYHVIDVAPEAGDRVNAAGGKALADWLVSPAAQRRSRRSASRSTASRCSCRTPARPTRRSPPTADMGEFVDALGEALSLLLSGDRETWEIIARSLRISLTATVLALAIGLPLAAGWRSVASGAGGSRSRSSTPAWASRRSSRGWS